MQHAPGGGMWAIGTLERVKAHPNPPGRCHRPHRGAGPRDARGRWGAGDHRRRPGGWQAGTPRGDCVRLPIGADLIPDSRRRRIRTERRCHNDTGRSGTRPPADVERRKRDRQQCWRLAKSWWQDPPCPHPGRSGSEAERRARILGATARNRTSLQARRGGMVNAER